MIKLIKSFVATIVDVLTVYTIEVKKENNS